jgi:hypothetical protein
MPFVVKDLMITLLPLRGDCGDAGASCLCTGCTGCTGDTNQTKGTPCSDGCPADFMNMSWVELVALKQQLREKLAAVEARENLVMENLRPKSAAEIEALKHSLQAALDELNKGAPGEAG